MKQFFILIIAAGGLMSCDRTENWTTIDFLSGTWEGQEITNYIKIQSYPGALTPHSTAHLLNSIDTTIHQLLTVQVWLSTKVTFCYSTKLK